MDNALLAILLFLAVWGFSIIREDIKKARYKAILIVNVDSSESDEYDLPREHIQMRKTVFLCAPPTPGMFIEVLGPERPCKVIETTIGNDAIAVRLETIKVPVAAVRNEATCLERFDWKISR